MAIRFNDVILDALEEIQADLLQAGLRGNFTRVENLHLTLAFIGEYGDVGAVRDTLGDVEFSPFEISLQGIGRFGDLYWAGIRESDDLEKLAKRIRRALAEAGIPFDRKKFNPHITLVRKAVYRGQGALPEVALPEVSMQADHFLLMNSERGRNGMIYSEIGYFG
ncbi:MAG: RNA 2',3'-cyclic phosphodiesterase [Lachnospiraceae bacterium]|nr:RNA 2',3'-cyclic phosphodiesterase [Lachnospiraceae bacterium]